MPTTRKRRRVVKDILWLVATVGLVAAVTRFLRGLGATTALNDATPWGLWIGFDVMAGVALAAGGFVIAATVYIFHLDKYRPILRPAILTALLGYGAVIIGLLCDLGLPWHIWKPIFHWQHHSVLFEVAWCVMLYTSVLALEFSPAILEHAWFQQPVFQRLLLWLKRLTVGLVIAGVILSTLHQSSLGSLFLIMPFRLHPLWYSPLLPVLFFISAVALGLMMVTLEGFISSYLYDHPVKVELYAGLGRAAAWVLWLYVGLRLVDLLWRGILPAGLAGSWLGFLFLVEVGFGMVVPAILLTIPAVRLSRPGLLTCALLTVGGMVLNRLAVGFIAIVQTPGATYVPAWPEVAVSAGIVAGAALVFLFLTEHFRVLDAAEAPLAEQVSPYARPTFDAGTRLYVGHSLWETVARRSFLLLPAAALTVALIPSQGVAGQARANLPIKAALGWEMMAINGNRDHNRVEFDHQAHQQRLVVTSAEGEEICSTCHHLSKPNDEATACWECHQSMHGLTSIFDHTRHQLELGGNASCVECHQGEHTAGTAASCGKCHEEMGPPPGQASFNHAAPGYKEAMHGVCIGCHQQVAEAQNRPALGQCTTCHRPDDIQTIGVRETEAARNLPDRP